MEQYEGDVKKGKSKWMLWLVVGVVVIIGVVVMVTQLGGNKSSVSGLTIDDLSAIVTQHSTTIQGFTTWKATATEDLSNLNTKQQQILSQLSGITNPKDWTSDINTLKANFTALQIAWGSVNQTIVDAIKGVNVTMPRYAMAYKVENVPSKGIYVYVSTYGEGDYPVIISLYGSNLNLATITVNPFQNNYAKVGDYQSGNWTLRETEVTSNYTVYQYDLDFNATERLVVVEPIISWVNMDEVIIKAEGSGFMLSYASAAIGQGEAKAVGGW